MPTDITWRRIDGLRIKDNAQLERQFDADEAVCQGEMAKSDSMSTAPVSRRLSADGAIYKGCMSARGYSEVR